MTIKLSQAVLINAALAELANKDKENKLLFSSAIRYRIRDNLKKTKPIVDSYQEENNALIEKFGTPSATNPSQKEVRQDSENWAAFAGEFENLLKEDVELEVKPLTESELTGAETKDFRIDIATMISLENLGLLVSDNQADVIDFKPAKQPKIKKAN